MRAPGELIDVNGRAVHVMRRQSNGGAPDRPLFLIEAACGWHSAMYAWIVEELAVHGSVIAYDRSGLGWSGPLSAAPDGGSRARELRDLLEALDIKSPVVLIGHSIAALYLRNYVYRWRHHVMGLVFLDSTHHLVYRLFEGRLPTGERIRRWVASCAHGLGVKRLPFPLLRMSELPWNALPEQSRREIEYLSAIPGLTLTERAEQALLGAASRQAQACGDLGDMPLLVMTGAIRTEREQRYCTHPQAFMDTWMLLQRDLVSLSTRGEHRVIEGAGHCDLVTDNRYAAQVCANIVAWVNGISRWRVSDTQDLPGPSEKDRGAYAFGDAGDYALGPDSLPQPGVPRGTIAKHRLEESVMYPGTAHDYWIYTPQQYDPQKPVCLTVFLDGESFLDETINAPIVLDNLIHQRQIPPMLGLFVNPGDKGPGLPLWSGTDNRSVEYDSVDDRYARFLLEELMPRMASAFHVSADPNCRCIAGISSGGVAAFTAAWQRPDAFRKVISFVGSFTDIRGGNLYPSLIRRGEKKPLRVFLQSGSKDLDIVFGNWPLANRDMAAALAYREYDHQFIFGEGGHSAKHGAALFPDALCWLWR